LARFEEQKKGGGGKRIGVPKGGGGGRGRLLPIFTEATSAERKGTVANALHWKRGATN